MNVENKSELVESAEKHKDTITVPESLLLRTNGLAIDIGGTMTKFIYRQKLKSDAGISDDQKTTSLLHVLAVRNQELKHALELLKPEVEITEPVEKQIVYVSGIGYNQLQPQLEDTFKLKIRSISEFEAFAKAFVYLASTMSRRDFFEPYSNDIGGSALTASDKIRVAFENLGSSKNKGPVSRLDISGQTANESDLPVSVSETDLYPCLLVVYGSAITFLKVTADGGYSVVDYSRRGCVNLAGLASLLTQTHTLEELLELAARGNSRAVNTHASDLIERSATNGDNFYNSISQTGDALIYQFGKCVGVKLDEVDSCDVAAALLQQFLSDITQLTSLVAHAADVTRVFFSGGFSSNVVIRSQLTVQMIKRNVFLSAVGQRTVKFDFIKAGAYLGALGALVAQCGETLTNGTSTENN